MSHFTTYVILPRHVATLAIPDYLEGILAPYCEHIEVEPYQAECHCVGAARRGGDLNPQPDSRCETCRGAGVRQSTYNPISKWDWWEIGGRWDGVIQDAPTDDDAPGDWASLLNRNLASVDDLVVYRGAKFDDVAVPFALVDVDGQWYERGEMGWFGVSFNDMPVAQWRRTVRSIYRKRAGHRVVGCDLHI